ncbi:helix-turn-helix transcriptional regulator [Microlunatus speluncae]|uniref:helix-turn-helix transcriptional regulator n=1 Tax=Microlunatus speluncae TaxID=2594267 RepID=UPI0012664E09|nr:hypothetical protein [Microlunatus speluncae]
MKETVLPPPTAADYLAQEIQARGWGVAGFAARSGITLELLQDILAGVRSINLQTARRLAVATGTTIWTWLRVGEPDLAFA